MTNEELLKEIEKVDKKLEKFIDNDFHHLCRKFDWMLGLLIGTLTSTVTGVIILYLQALK